MKITKTKIRKSYENEKLKLKNSAVKKTLILGNSIIKNVDYWRFEL